MITAISKIFISINVNINIITDYNIIANKYNEYVVKVGANLAKYITETNDDTVTNYFTGSYTNSQFFNAPIMKILTLSVY